MFKLIASKIQAAVTQYRAQRVRDVVDGYMNAVGIQASSSIPIIIEGYRGLATALVDKTFEDPKPIINLIAAIENAAIHYGPAIKAEFELMKTKLEDTKSNAALVTAMDHLEVVLNNIDAPIHQPRSDAP